MTKEQIESYVIALGNVGIALSNIEVKGEDNLNFLLASIQTVRNVRDGLKEGDGIADHNV